MILKGNMKTKTIDFSGINALYTRVSDFPLGVEYSFKKMELKLQKSIKRKFFGALLHCENEVVYHACASQIMPNEHLVCGFQHVEIPGGKYMSYTLQNWSKNTHLIKEIFQELEHKYLFDTSRPQLELYRSNKELEIMLPIKNREEQLRLMFD